ncbi:MAG: sterol desaturase family protein, partial [Myxococcales bacterium]|nr:sterol desaturase family protein [Myxococcales bacterium]
TIHAVHHSIKSPMVLDTFYVHPMETVLTVSLLFVVIMSVGPISVHAFGGVLAVVSCFNVTNHAGSGASGLFPRGVAGMVDAHMRHHAGMQAGNFASLTKLPDLLFGTDE